MTTNRAYKDVTVYIDVMPLNGSEEEPVFNVWPVFPGSAAPSLFKGSIRFKAVIQLYVPLKDAEEIVEDPVLAERQGKPKL